MKGIWRSAKASANKGVLAACLLVTAAAACAADWKIEAVDPRAGAGEFASLVIDNDGNGHLAYVTDDGFHTLRYGFWDHRLKRWFTMPVTGSSGSFCTIALDSKQRPRISYADFGGSSGARLRYAYWDGQAWKSHAIPLNDDVIGYYTSIILDAKDVPTLSFYEYGGPGGIFILRLRAVTLRNHYWEERTIDPAPGSGKFNSMAIGSDGKPRIAYANVKDENASLRYAEFDGESWKREILEGQNQSFYVYSVAMVLDKQNNPHITYTDVRGERVKYATRTGGRWQLDTVDSIIKEAYPDRNGIALDANGNPYMSYYDAGAGALKLAHRTPSGWVTEEVDRNGAGFQSSLQIHDNEIWLVYSDEGEGTLKCARRAIEPDRPLSAGPTALLPQPAAEGKSR